MRKVLIKKFLLSPCELDVQPIALQYVVLTTLGDLSGSHYDPAYVNILFLSTSFFADKISLTMRVKGQRHMT
jgi:hypothetical protein